MEFYASKCDLSLGRIIIELYHDYNPVTVQNFLSICRGEHGITYEKCQIHNVVRGQYIETGDITLGNGKGGMSIYGETFDEECHILKHTKMGLLNAENIFPFQVNFWLNLRCFVDDSQER